MHLVTWREFRVVFIFGSELLKTVDSAIIFIYFRYFILELALFCQFLLVLKQKTFQTSERCMKKISECSIDITAIMCEGDHKHVSSCLREMMNKYKDIFSFLYLPLVLFCLLVSVCVRKLINWNNEIQSSINTFIGHSHNTSYIRFNRYTVYILGFSLFSTCVHNRCKTAYTTLNRNTFTN